MQSCTFQMYSIIIFTTMTLSAVGYISAESITTAHKDLHQWTEFDVALKPEIKYAPSYKPLELLPNLCFENYALKMKCGIESLSRNFHDIHAWNAIKLYRGGPWVGDVVEYLNRCEKSYGGKVKIFLKSLNKRLNDFSRPLPLTHFGARNLCEDLCVIQAVRGAVFPNVNLAKYEKEFNTTQDELLNIANDPILLNVISEMCEKMFNVQINCSFERYENIPEKTERILVEYLLQISIDVKHYLKYNAQQESVVLPTGYIENPYKHRDESGGATIYNPDSQCRTFFLTFSNGSISM